MAYLVLTLDILVVCVLICSQTFIDNFSGFCGGESINKNKGTFLKFSGLRTINVLEGNLPVHQQNLKSI